MAKSSLPTDSELLELIQAHDTQGLDGLFRRYATQLHRFAIQLVEDQEDARELVSDLFLHIWVKRETLRIHTQLKSYLYTALRNRCLNHLRKHAPPSVDLAEAEGDARYTTDPSDHLISEQETAILMESILAHLPPQRKLVFQLHRIDGFSYQEIAHILSISEHTVHRHMVKAVKQLAERYPHWKTDFLVAVVLWGLAINL